MERHRIHELFTEDMLNSIIDIMNDPQNTSNNMKVDKILDVLVPKGFSEIGPGTNRLCVKYKEYVYKIAMDTYGIRDNWNEFDMSPRLQPYVTKTYECNGIVNVAEYVNLISKNEFIDSKEHIRSILKFLSRDYLFCDLSTNMKNYLNYGWRDTGDIVIIDYGLTK